MTPTQLAEQNLDRAIHHFRRIQDDHLSFGLQSLAMALQQIAVGLRATYQSTEQVRESVRPAQPGRKIA